MTLPIELPRVTSQDELADSRREELRPAQFTALKIGLLVLGSGLFAASMAHMSGNFGNMTKFSVSISMIGFLSSTAFLASSLFLCVYTSGVSLHPPV